MPRGVEEGPHQFVDLAYPTRGFSRSKRIERPGRCACPCPTFHPSFPQHRFFVREKKGVVGLDNLPVPAGRCGRIGRIHNVGGTCVKVLGKYGV